MSISTSLCRSCDEPLEVVFADLGKSPVSNAFRSAETMSGPEKHYPLKAYYCTSCHLVQLLDFQSSEDHFNENYAYFSSFSSAWLKHAEEFSRQTISQLSLGSKSMVVEVASNDGYLLQYFQRAGIQVLGIEPSASVAQAAEKNHGIRTIRKFFGRSTAEELVENGVSADLIVANNVLAHVPDIRDFVAGFKILLAETGTASFEFPHLLQLIKHSQFDTIYHEHYSYLSLTAVEGILRAHGLKTYNVEELATHGGSLRLFVCHVETDQHVSNNVAAILTQEAEFGLLTPERYIQFQQQIVKLKRDMLSLLIDAKNTGKSIVGYGAPAKGNTLLNYCGIGPDFLDYTVDMSPHKQGMFLPGSNIPVLSPDEIATTRPDLILILPWNLADEITTQLDYVRAWGAKFIVPIPVPAVL
jgi:SAM-dependent methyltransferase